MFGSPDITMPDYDDETLDRMRAAATARSGRLRLRRHRVRSVATAAGLASVVALAATLVTLNGLAPRNPAPAAHQATGTTRAQAAAPQWSLVGDVSPAWHEVSGLTGDPGLELSCPGVTTCYAANLKLGQGGIASVEVTTDGGRSWTSSKLPVALLGPTHIVCAAVDTCALLGLSGTVSCPTSNLCQVTGSPSSVFEETTDGGASWTSHPGPADLTSLIGLSAMACPSASSCLAVESGGYGAGGSEAFVTTDAGQTWKAESMPADFVPRELQCSSVTACYATGFFQSPEGSQTSPGGTVLYTTDGGATWATASLPSGLGPFGSTSCATATDCLGIFSGGRGQSGDVLASTDGGATWSRSAASGLPSGVVLSLACPSAARCWAAGLTDAQASANAVSIANGAAGLIASTSDGGQTWQSVPVPSGITQVASLSCPSTTDCYALAFETSTSEGGPFFTVVMLRYGS